MLAIASAYAGERAAGPALDGLQWISRVEPFIARLGDASADARARLYHGALAGYLGDVSTKLALAQSVLDLPAQTLPETSNLRAAAWAGVGTAMRSSGREEDARRAYEQALAHYERTLGPDHPAAVGALLGLANLATNQRNVADAEALLLRALRLTTSTWGDEDVRTVSIRNDLGNTLLTREEFEAALEQYDRAHRTAEAKLGLRHPQTALTATNRGRTAAHLGRLDEAEADLRDAVATFEATGEHPDHLAGARLRLGDVLLQRGRLDEARALYEAAAAALQHVERSPDLANAVSGLASVASALGDHAAAVRHRRRIVELRANASPTSRAVAQMNLAMALVETGELDEARTLVDATEPLLPEPRDALAERLFAGIAELRAGPLTQDATDRRPRSSSTARDPHHPPDARP
jgi:tetratricopeptide (TPR) repeat protein